MSKRFVYILRSLSTPDRRYVGLTSDVDRRLAAHNAGTSPFTAKFRPWVVTTRVEFEDEHRAAAFERYLKSPSGRAFAKRHLALDQGNGDAFGIGTERVVRRFDPKCGCKCTRPMVSFAATPLGF